MSELHERVTEGLFEEKRHQAERSKFHRGENKQSRRAEGTKSETNKIKQIKIELDLLNMPMLALEVSGPKRAGHTDPINSDTTISFLDILEIILKMIVDGAKAILSTRKAKTKSTLL
jgi:hypothetical protein